MIEKNVKEKQGISLIVLLITIAVMLILLAVIVISVDNVANNSKLSAFATDLSTVEDLTNAYYMQNNSFPVKVESGKKDEDMLMSQGALLTKVGDENKNKFVEELKLNNDYNQESDDLGEYYPIDLSKLDINSSKRGILKDGDEKDIYVVSYPSMNIYYLKGVKVKKDTYFSLSSKLTNKVKLNNDMTYKNDNTTTVQSIDGLTVKKMTKSWTNSMGIYVQANLKSGEELYLEATNVSKKKLITNEGNNEFNFNDLSEVNGFTSEESNTFKNSEQKSKKITFVKQRGTEELGRIEVDMSNYETMLPSYQIVPENIIYSEEYNMVPINISDSISGVKEVRYEYLTKYDENGNLQNYYTNISEYDVNYLKNKGKKAIPDKNGDITLKIDKDIEGIQLIVIDKAGNILSKNEEGKNLTVGLYKYNNDMYIGLDLKSNTEKLLSYGIVLINKNGISGLEISTSADGINYSDIRTIEVNSSSAESIKKIEDKQEELGKVSFLKVTAIDNSTLKNKKTRIFKLNNKTSLEIGKIVDESQTFNLKKAGTYYNPVIPKGFAPINEGEAIWGSAEGWNNGLVIRDEIGNEFVWVPVESVDEADFDNKFVTYPWELGASTFATYFEREDDEFNAMKNSVKKNGGFYIARYEACYPETGNPNIVDGTQKPLSKSNLTVWGGQNQAKAELLSRCMYPNLDKLSEFGLPTTLTNTSGVISTLVFGRQWDMALKFINKDYPDYISNSKNYGNYSKTQNIAGNVLLKSGSNNNYSLKNIYDMAGNLEEITMEYFGSELNPVARGGCFNTLQENASVTDRNYTYSSNDLYSMGFRVTLYINN